MRRIFIFLVSLWLFLPWEAFDLDAKSNFSKKYTRAFTQACQNIAILSVSKKELAHLIEYVEFFSSWYAPLTLVSNALHGTLSIQSLQFIEDLKALAKNLERKPDKLRSMGSSKLSVEGRIFYENVLHVLRDKYLESF